MCGCLFFHKLNNLHQAFIVFYFILFIILIILVILIILIIFLFYFILSYLVFLFPLNEDEVLFDNPYIKIFVVVWIKDTKDSGVR